MADVSTNSRTQGELLDRLSQNFVSRLRSGESPDLEEYARLHPELAEDIRDLFPAAAFAEQLHAEATDRSLPNPLHQAMHLGAFHLQREIGSGGMGVVYEATQSPFSQKFAVKVLKPKHFRSSHLESRFIREAQAASQLHHPNIVPAKYYGTEANQSFLVMPMIDGVGLDKLILADPSVDPRLYLLFEDICNDWKRIAGLGAQVASALAHAHSKGTIHRDIKPSNLILALDGKVWVTDFGLAKLCDEDSNLSRTGGTIGTPQFMAPEQSVGAADERSDIYGLGITLYDIVTRDCPRHGALALELGAKKHSKKSASGTGATPALEIPDIRKLNPAVPECLAKVIMKACAHDPDSRYQSARELELALNELSFRGISDRRNSLRSRAMRSKHQAYSVAILMIICLFPLSMDWHLKPSSVNSDWGNSSRVEQTVDQTVLGRKSFVTFEEPGNEVTNLVIPINRRADDAEEYGKGTMFLDGRDLDMTRDETEQIVGLRFTEVDIPPGTEISSAKLCFYADRSESEATDLRIFGVDDANPKSFTPLDYDISKRPRVQRTVEWTPGPWKGGKLYESPECKEIVATIINNPDWKSGNAIAFVIEGKGIRAATAYDGNYYYSPILKIQYRRNDKL